MLVISPLPNYNNRVSMKQKGLKFQSGLVDSSTINKPAAVGETVRNATKAIFSKLFNRIKRLPIPVIKEPIAESYNEIDSMFQSLLKVSNEQLGDMYKLALSDEYNKAPINSDYSTQKLYETKKKQIFYMIDSLAKTRGLNYWYIKSKGTDHEAPKFEENDPYAMKCERKETKMFDRGYKYLQEMIIKEYKKVGNSCKASLRIDFSKNVEDAFDLLIYMRGGDNIGFQFNPDYMPEAHLSTDENREYTKLETPELLDLFYLIEDDLKDVKCGGHAPISNQRIARVQYIYDTLEKELKSRRAKKSK